jgi:hypothetical protein
MTTPGRWKRSPEPPRAAPRSSAGRTRRGDGAAAFSPGPLHLLADPEREVIETHRYDCVAVLGALTPTEILTAWSLGADVVKVFPANHFGPQYVRRYGPMPQVKLILPER